MFTDVAAGSSYEDFCHDEIVPYKLEKEVLSFNGSNLRNSTK